MSKDISRDIRVDVSPEESSPKQLAPIEIKNITVKRIPPVYTNPSKAGYFRPWRFNQAERSGTSKIFYAKSTRFRIILDVIQFSPNLKIDVADRTIKIEGQHDVKRDKLGNVSRWMLRKYKVPPDVKLDTIQSNLRTKGSLILNAERNLEDSLGENIYKEYPKLMGKKSTTEKPRA